MPEFGYEFSTSVRQQFFAHDPSPQPEIGVWVVSSGRFRHTPHHIRSRRSPEDHILYCVSGEARFTLNEQTYRITPGTLYYVPGGELHCYGNLEDKDWEVWWVHFDGDYARRLLAQVGLTGATPLVELGVDEHLVDGFNKVCQCCQAPNPAAKYDTAAAFIELLLRAMKANEGIGAVADHMEMLSWRHRSIEDVAQAHGMSTEHFIRQFKANTGITPWKHITRLKVIRAKELLATTCATNAEMAKELGLSNADYFSAWFSRHVGCSPRAFRQRSITG